jgi:hypothetical protein
VGTLNYLGAVLMAFGGILAIWVLSSAGRRWALLRRPVRVKGEVVHIRCVQSPSDSAINSGLYYATVRYRSEDGHMIERELPPSGKSDKWKVGDVIPLVYERGNARNVIDKELRWADLVANAVGTLVVLLIGVLLCFFVESAPPNPPAAPPTTRETERTGAAGSGQHISARSMMR